MTIVKPLYGHTSFETAYMTDDYPYGRLRCKAWFWVEHKSTKGFRLGFRTENPKTGRLNASKYDTYSKLAEELYLDENNHVKSFALNEFSEPKHFLEFIQHFHESKYLTRSYVFAGAKADLYKGVANSGKEMFKFNGESQALTEDSKARYYDESQAWADVAAEFKKYLNK